MKRLVSLVLIALFAVAVPAISTPDVDAQAQIYVTDAAQAAASDIVNGRIVSTTSVEVNGEMHRATEIEISSTTKGDLQGSVIVETPGGERADGAVVYVSHTPALIPGELVQLALMPAAPEASYVLPVATDRDLPVYSVAGGSEGAWGLLPDGVGQAEAVGDYTLTGASWDDFAPAVPFNVNPANSGVSTAGTIAAVQRAFQTWEDDAGSDIDFAYTGTTTKSGLNLNDGQNTVSWVNPPAGSGWLAQASWIATGGGDIIGFDVRVSRSYNWSNGAASGRYDIGTVVAHEVGHGIGFGHAPSSAELMYFQIQGGTIKDLGAGDKSGAAFLYPDTSQDNARVDGAWAILSALQSYGVNNGTYTVAGGGWGGFGQGAFEVSGGAYPNSIRNVMTGQGYFPGGAPSDPGGRSYLVYLCDDRVAVWSKTYFALPSSASLSWWNSNSCPSAPAALGYQHLVLSQPVVQDNARVDGAWTILNALQSYGSNNGTYAVAGGGWGGFGQGAFEAAGGAYPNSIENVLSSQGYFSSGAPTDPAGRSYLVYRCGDRVGVWSKTDSALPSSSSLSWWSSNSCPSAPAALGYQHLVLSQAL